MLELCCRILVEENPLISVLDSIRTPLGSASPVSFSSGQRGWLLSREGVRETLNHLGAAHQLGRELPILRRPIPGLVWHLQRRRAGDIGRDCEAERVTLPERTLASLAKARKQEGVGGGPKLVLRRDQVAAHRAAGLSITAISEKMEIPRTSVHRILKELAGRRVVSAEAR